MTLLSRIGAARTGYSTVLYPVVALALSTVLEGYVWTLPAMIGLGLVILGNIVMLTSRT
jgi:drug/metabolite transporter (DMT)-like permease